MSSTLQTECKFDGCSRKVVARGWCGPHYFRWRKYGRPDGGRKTITGEPLAYYIDSVLPYRGQDCLTWPFGAFSDGYGQMWRDGRRHRVSRLVCQEVYGPAPTDRHEAAHNCGKGHLKCVAPTHLEWKLPKENQADRTVHGTDIKGEQQWRAKLTRDDVYEIRDNPRRESRRQLAERFNVSNSNIDMIVTRRTWAWLPECRP